VLHERFSSTGVEAMMAIAIVIRQSYEKCSMNVAIKIVSVLVG
jgi:hypothetical protein